MRGLILCEGNADRILTSYYIIKVLNYKYYAKNNWGKSYTTLNFDKDNYDWYVDAAQNSILLGAVGGYNFAPKVKTVLTWNYVNGIAECFDKLVIITDNDDKTALHRLESCKRELRLVAEDNGDCGANAWCSYTFTNVFAQHGRLEFLFLFQPQGDYGNLETFVLNALASCNEQEKNVVDKARKYVAQIDRSVYLRNRGDKNKAELAAYFAVVAPKRTFEKIDTLLKMIDWQQYEMYNEQFALLRKLTGK